MKPTKSKNTAIERLTTLLPRVRARREGRTWHITVDGSGMTTQKTKAAALAWLADLARYTDVDPAGVRWTGTVPTRGLAAWEQSALEWLSQNGG